VGLPQATSGMRGRIDTPLVEEALNRHVAALTAEEFGDVVTDSTGTDDGDTPARHSVPEDYFRVRRDPRGLGL